MKYTRKPEPTKVTVATEATISMVGGGAGVCWSGVLAGFCADGSFWVVVGGGVVGGGVCSSTGGGLEEGVGVEDENVAGEGEGVGDGEGDGVGDGEGWAVPIA